ncbi:thymidine phosphorylase-like isoform X2 [Lycorma delicatula]|uniref:thymidine phosphorylase-like isoform X2 n=1 Tax=Lycorma delicatula TaxID=130591 RepID=UPI003F517B4B
MHITELLKKKRNGKELNESEIKYFVNNTVNGNIQESQIGDVLSWNSEWSNMLVDKHSTGGVGDKISIPLAPSLAACGLKVPMISGRGLDITGGTLDKLESIPGFNVNLTKPDLDNCLEDAGCFIISTTENLCPADQIFYTKRNETSTVDYINLIVGSIISKKAAENVKHLILDIKVGQGAFMKDIESARKLAKQMVDVSHLMGIKTKAYLTRMDHPLGRTVGNALEIDECVKLMQGQYIPHIHELVTIFGGSLLEMSGKADTLESGKKMIKEVLKNNKALECFYKMLIDQGVQEEICNNLCYGDKTKALKLAKYQTEILASKTGWIEQIDVLIIGTVCYQLAGVVSNNNLVDHSTGAVLPKTIGEHIEADEPWLIIYHSTPTLNFGKNTLENAIKISDNKIDINCDNLIIEWIE